MQAFWTWLDPLLATLSLSRDQAETLIWVFTVIFITLLVGYFVRRAITRLEATLATKPGFKHATVTSAKGPARLGVWTIGLSSAAEVALLGTELGDWVDPIRETGVVVAIAWFLIRLVKAYETALISNPRRSDRIDRTTAEAIGRLLRVAVMITASLVVLQAFGFSLSGVLAFGGVGGIAVGFAAKDLLANFFGGFFIYTDRPFVVGDWVRSPDREIEGTVEHIGWRLTRIRTFDKRPLYIPNSTFLSIAVENPSRMTNRRIYETIGVRYDDAAKLPAIVADVEAMLRSHADIDGNQTLIVNFDKFASSSLDFFVYTFTKTTDWVTYHSVKQDVLFRILGIVEAHEAQCAFPTSTLHIASMETAN
ncbi:mechanosensitive ion channel family protein [Litorivicinus lipolyticus]|uniref:mechanosensitive ion channel family protein n=1 Tax=Litorivicinus lipolyticus TaxID=418701 RepID=UPI001FE80EE3|nr:mechanosensitive ion channel family protein [Litorivicinus lipolyticus]